MLRRLSIIFALIFVGYSSTARGCSPPSPDDDLVDGVVISPAPSEETPIGALQLKVAFPGSENPEGGRIYYSVLEVIDGVYDEEVIVVNVSNVNFCNNYIFSIIGNSNYITAMPLIFSDGEPVKDNKGLQEFGAVLYKGLDEDIIWSESPLPKYVDYAEYQEYSFYDEKRIGCVLDGRGTAEAWRRCVKPGEYVSLDCDPAKSGALICEESDYPEGRPPDLARGYRSVIQRHWILALGFFLLVAISVSGWRMRHKRVAG